MVVERIHDDPAGAAALIAAGGRLDRHSVAMVLDLTDATPNQPLPAGFAIAPMDAGRSSEYGELVVRAYPPEHPDHEPADADPASAAESILGYLRGDADRAVDRGGVAARHRSR